MGLITAQNIRKEYQTGEVSIAALKEVSFEIEPASFVSFIGPSGSGKSTMLNLIGALDKPTGGTLRIDGVDIGKLNDNQLAELRLKIGFVFQFFNLIPRLTARDNVELSLSIANKSKSQRRQRAIELLETALERPIRVIILGSVAVRDMPFAAHVSAIAGRFQQLGNRERLKHCGGVMKRDHMDGMLGVVAGTPPYMTRILSAHAGRQHEISHERHAPRRGPVPGTHRRRPRRIHRRSAALGEGPLRELVRPRAARP